jgi:hypothetical protein
VNTTTDRIIALTALAGFIVFLAVLVWFVAEIDLTIIIVGSVTLACYDFYGTLFKSKKTDS